MASSDANPKACPPAWQRTLGAYAGGVATGAACNALHSPIPWMLGPLMALAAFRVAGVDIAALPAGRYVGRWVAGTSLGLYCTPLVVREVASIWYLLAAGAVFAIVVGYLSAMLLSTLSGLDRTTALFSSVPGGVAEMAVIGEHYGARVDRAAVRTRAKLRRRTSRVHG